MSKPRRLPLFGSFVSCRCSLIVPHSIVYLDVKGDSLTVA